MFKWYVTRGYPLQELLETTYAERILLREAYRDWINMWKSMSDDPRLKDIEQKV